MTVCQAEMLVSQNDKLCRLYIPMGHTKYEIPKCITGSGSGQVTPVLKTGPLYIIG